MNKNAFKLLVAVGVQLLFMVGLFKPDLLAQFGAASRPAEAIAPSAAASPKAPAIAITIDQVIAWGLENPVAITHAGDGSRRLFIVEQPGRIRIFKNGALQSTPFLDIVGRVQCCGERGLLSVAFPPGYAGKGHFYVNYTRRPDGATVIARYDATSDPDIADPGSEQIILQVPQPYANHNGGQLAFSPVDGYLYIGMGDGGSGGDPQNYGQRTDQLLGKMLRIDVETGNPVTYTIPPGNPFTQAAGYRPEIWALGVRNPWRFSFDRATGDLYIGDVGQNVWEEIDFQAAGTPGGVNFGWRCREGKHVYDYSAAPCDAPAFIATLTDPIAEYDHGVGQSVTGGYVYRGGRYPALAGRYFYADYVQGVIWNVYRTGAGWSAPEFLVDAPFNLSTFGEDEDGELYVADYYNGEIHTLADMSGPAPDPAPDLSTSRKAASAPAIDTGEAVTFTVRLTNTGGLSATALFMTDTIPVGLAYVAGSLSASQGIVSDAGNPILRWQGSLTPTRHITITYRAAATGSVTGSLVNRARVAGAGISLTLSGAVFVPRSVFTSTHRDFILPGTQPNQMNAELRPSVDCDICHSAPIYDQWRGSPMSQAGRDPLMWAALTVANNDAPGSGEFCLRCHVPTGWLSGRSQPADGSAMLASDIGEGVSCAMCHRMVDPVPSTTDQAASIDRAIRAALAATGDLPITTHVASAMYIVDPNDNRRGPFKLSPAFPYHVAKRTDFFQQARDAQTAVAESRLCGTCHNVDNPALSWDAGRGQFWPNAADQRPPSVAQGRLYPIETTFDEWLNSQFAVTGVSLPKFSGAKPDGVVRSCQDCHMRRAAGQAADDQFNPIARDCKTTGCLPEHGFVGGNTWLPDLLQDSRWRLNASGDANHLEDSKLRAEGMLRAAARMTATLDLSGAQPVAAVRVINDTGHKLPTGYAEGRRMWIQMRAYDAAGSLVYESGAYDPATGILTETADTRVYEVRQGITPQLANLLGKSPGASFHFVLNNTVVKDNRIPPRGYTQAVWDRPGLEPVGAVYADGQYWDDARFTLPVTARRIVARLYYQTASKEYIDFLRQNGGVDGQALGAMWEGLKSPPVQMASVAAPMVPTFLPLVTR